MNEADYALGYAEAELRRLTTQAQLIDPITRRFLEAAGIGKGMRVLDIGSGAGDVAFLCREMVGTTGEVVGTDVSVSSVERATLRAKEANTSRVSFRHGDAAGLDFEQPFDAVVGRYVLQFMPDPARSLRRIVRHLRPGGDRRIPRTGLGWCPIVSIVADLRSSLQLAQPDNRSSRRPSTPWHTSRVSVRGCWVACTEPETGGGHRFWATSTGGRASRD